MPDRTRRAAAVGRMLGLLRPYPVRTVVALGLGLLVLALAVAPPLVLRHIVDHGLVERSRDALAGGALLLCLLAVAQFAVSAGRRQATGGLAVDVRCDLQGQLGERLLAEDADDPETGRSGGRPADLDDDVDAVCSFLGHGVPLLVLDGLTVVVALALMWSLSPALTLLAGAVVLPLAARSGSWLGAVLRRRSASVAWPAAGRTTRARPRHTGAVARPRAWVGPLTTALPQLAVVGLLWFGGHAVLAGELTLGSLLAFHSYLAVLAVPIAAGRQSAVAARQAMAGARRIFAVLDPAPAVLEPAPAVREPRPSGGRHSRPVTTPAPTSATPTSAAPSSFGATTTGATTTGAPTAAVTGGTTTDGATGNAAAADTEAAAELVTAELVAVNPRYRAAPPAAHAAGKQPT